MAKNEENFIFSMRLSPIDRKILDELCNAYEMSHSDIFKCALYEFAVADKSTLLKHSLKELARLKQMDFKMGVMKEIERVTHRQAFYLDGFRNLIETYYRKYVPIEIVRRYVTAKIISLYVLYHTGQRNEFVIYLQKHFLHFYPNEKKWFKKQLNYIRNLKQNEKDELLAKFRKELPAIKEHDVKSKRDMLEVQKG